MERRYDEVVPGSVTGDGRIDPGSRVLVFERIREPSAFVVVKDRGRAQDGEEFVEIVSVTPPYSAAPGETVTIRLRVGKPVPGCRYEIFAQPIEAETKILGPHRRVVKEDEVAEFRLTSDASGLRSVEVVLRRVW